jgi:hypothetical protein
MGPLSVNAKEDFPWLNSNPLCIEKELVLCGWVGKKFFPGCVGANKTGKPVRWSLKKLGKKEARDLVLKFNNDRNPDRTGTERDLTQLQHLAIGKLAQQIFIF